jgi:hypothetical protein
MNSIDLQGLSTQDIQTIIALAQKEAIKREALKKDQARRAVLAKMYEYGVTMDEILEIIQQPLEAVIRTTFIPSNTITYVYTSPSPRRGPKPKAPEKPKVIEPWKGKGDRPKWAMGAKLNRQA